MKFNYPIKYTAMPIVEQIGWEKGMYELDSVDEVVCYIVSKCYLVSELIKYKEDGSMIKDYEVVFPYQTTELNKWKKVIPTYNLIDGYCTNSKKVDIVFDSYEEALNYVTNENNKICKKNLIDLYYSKNNIKNIQQKKEEFKTNLLKYKLLEQQILLFTDSIKTRENEEFNSCQNYTEIDLEQVKRHVLKKCYKNN